MPGSRLLSCSSSPRGSPTAGSKVRFQPSPRSSFIGSLWRLAYIFGSSFSPLVTEAPSRPAQPPSSPTANCCGGLFVEKRFNLRHKNYTPNSRTIVTLFMLQVFVVFYSHFEGNPFFHRLFRWISWGCWELVASHK